MSPPQNPLNFSQTIPPQKRKPPSEVSPDSKSSSSKKQKQKESRVKFTLPPVSQVYHHKNKGLEESVIESDVDDNEDLLESQKQKSKTSLRNADDLDSESESEEENNKLDTEDDNEDDENYEGEDGPDEDNRSRTSDDEEDEEEKEIKIVPFSMREELEEGDFDASGTYFLKPRDKFAHHDNWLAGISKKEIKMVYLEIHFFFFFFFFFTFKTSSSFSLDFFT
ncbi:hypothetical protein HMI56_005417 [Coelomomyces lativittatus]|nr:hypothetical protein HMI56_005417 [Coelomomyces lativittatus]